MGCNISIYGMCCARDILGLHKDDGGYTVERFVQSVSPVSAVSKKMLLKELADDDVIKNIFKNRTAFCKKMVTLDLTKRVFSYLSEVQSEFFLIDAGLFRYDLLVDNEGGCLTDLFPEINQELIKEAYLPSNLSRIELSLLNDIDFEKIVDIYLERIKEMYEESQVILYEFWCVPYFVNKARNGIGVYDYGKIQKLNQNIKRGYKLLKKKLPQAHVVEFPYGVLGDEGHKWGGNYLHYIPEYYDYGLEALNIITEQHLPVAEEKQHLSELKRSYELKIKQIYEPICVKSMQTYRQRDNICSRMEAYEAYMKDLLMDKNKIDKIKNFFIENHFESCAFYGLTELSKLFIPFFKQWGIHIDYVIEEIGQKEYEGIKIIKKSAPFYPDIPVMIITEVIYKDQVKEKLASRDVAYPYYDVYDILN